MRVIVRDVHVWDFCSNSKITIIMAEHEVLLDDIKQETIRPSRKGNKMTRTDAKENIWT